MVNEFNEQRKLARQRFFEMLQIAQSNANLSEQEVEQLAAEAVKASEPIKTRKEIPKSCIFLFLWLI